MYSVLVDDIANAPQRAVHADCDWAMFGSLQLLMGDVCKFLRARDDLAFSGKSFFESAYVLPASFDGGGLPDVATDWDCSVGDKGCCAVHKPPFVTGFLSGA